MMIKVLALVMAMAAVARCQRPSYAGFRPIGYPEVTSTSTEGLADRFGEVDATTQRLPVEANGDRELMDRLSKLPIDKQPFWFINWQALEANRQKPQTFPQKPNPFIDPIVPSSGNNAGNFVSNQNLGNRNSGAFVNPNTGSLGSNGNLVTPSNVNSASSVPLNSNTPSVDNRISGNANAGQTSPLEDRFSGGIAPNRFPENEQTFVNYKPGKTVSVEDDDDDDTV